MICILSCWICQTAVSNHWLVLWLPSMSSPPRTEVLNICVVLMITMDWPNMWQSTHTITDTQWNQFSPRVWIFLRLWWPTLLSDHFCVFFRSTFCTNTNEEITKQYTTKSKSELFIQAASLPHPPFLVSQSISLLIALILKLQISFTPLPWLRRSLWGNAFLVRTQNTVWRKSWTREVRDNSEYLLWQLERKALN